MFTGICFVNMKDRENLTDLQVNWRMILKWMLTKKDGDLNWIHLAQETKHGKILVNIIIDFRVPFNHIRNNLITATRSALDGPVQPHIHSHPHPPPTHTHTHTHIRP